jgi:hypothetical protein
MSGRDSRYWYSADHCPWCDRPNEEHEKSFHTIPPGSIHAELPGYSVGDVIPFWYCERRSMREAS